MNPSTYKDRFVIVAPQLPVREISGTVMRTRFAESFWTRRKDLLVICAGCI